MDGENFYEILGFCLFVFGRFDLECENYFVVWLSSEIGRFELGLFYF